MKKTQINCYMEAAGLAGCCGTFTISNLEQQENGYIYGQRAKQFASRQEVLEDFDKRLEEFLISDCFDYDYGNGPQTRSGSQVGYITLVTRYGLNGDNEGQFPELLTHLLITEWRVDREWINSNSGNSIIQLSKEFLAEDYKPKVEEETEEDSDVW